MKRLRSMSVYMAIASIVYMIVIQFIDVDLGKFEMVIELIAGVLIALGILTDTGKDPLPISKASLLEKLKSPLAVNSIFALLVFIIYDYAGVESGNMMVNSLSTLLFVVFGVAVRNNPNSRDSFR